jgi:hypothetical protein
MAFTVIDGDTSWQDLSIAQEIVSSYNLRRTLCGLSTMATPSEATIDNAFILALQTGIAEMADNKWVNNSGSLSAFEGQSAYPAKMSTSTTMAAAGLTSTGYWRRIAEGGSQPGTWTDYGAVGWSYGTIASKDLAGPWLFKDLQLALSAMSRTLLPYTRWRSKAGSYIGERPIQSTAISFAAWQTSSTPSPAYYTQKGRRCSASLNIVEWQRDIPATVAACEVGHLLLTLPRDLGFTSYATYTGKTGYANLSVADVTTVLGLTVGNSCSVSTAGATTSYLGLIAEDANNLIPLCNSILPDANVPVGGNIECSLAFDEPCLILDFTFE